MRAKTARKRTPPPASSSPAEVILSEAKNLEGAPGGAGPHGLYAVGRILGPWGIRGDVSIQVLSDNPRRFQPGSQVLLDGQAQTVERYRQASGKGVLKLSGVPDRTAAETLKGKLLEIEEADLMQLPPDIFFEHQILDLQVETTDGRPLGRVVDILKTGSNDVYVVKGDREHLIPAIGDVVKSIDIQARRMTIEAIPGLLD